jgi:hypothetical protein
MTSATECDNPSVEKDGGDSNDARSSLQEYVLDLSISLRTGKETNMDFPSSGERTGRSSDGNLFGEL